MLRALLCRSWELWGGVSYVECNTPLTSWKSTKLKGTWRLVWLVVVLCSLDTVAIQRMMKMIAKTRNVNKCNTIASTSQHLISSCCSNFQNCGHNAWRDSSQSPACAVWSPGIPKAIIIMLVHAPWPHIFLECPTFLALFEGLFQLQSKLVCKHLRINFLDFFSSFLEDYF